MKPFDDSGTGISACEIGGKGRSEFLLRGAHVERLAAILCISRGPCWPLCVFENDTSACERGPEKPTTLSK